MARCRHYGATGAPAWVLTSAIAEFARPKLVLSDCTNVASIAIRTTESSARIIAYSTMDAPRRARIAPLAASDFIVLPCPVLPWRRPLPSLAGEQCHTKLG